MVTFLNEECRRWNLKRKEVTLEPRLSPLTCQWNHLEPTGGVDYITEVLNIEELYSPPSQRRCGVFSVFFW